MNKRKNNNEVKVKKIGYGEVFKAIDRLTEQEKNILLGCLKIEEIKNILSSKESTDKYTNSCTDTANFYLVIAEIIKKVYDYMKNPKKETDVVMETYNGLNEVDKKEIALDMLSNRAFLEDSCEILQSDFDKWGEMNPFIKSISKSLLKFMETLIAARKCK